MKEYIYTVVLEREEDGGFHAFCPALPGCHTHGDSYDETIEQAGDAIKLYVESLEAHGVTIPEEDVIIKAVKVAI